MSVIKLNPGMKILFQGDSITDCERLKTESELGNGYVAAIAGTLGAHYPQLSLRFVNRGISGNRVRDLELRWMKDCIEVEPDVVSILIGINDVWRRYDRNLVTTLDEYFESYHSILTQVKVHLAVPIILCEPFVLPVADKVRWREDLDPKISVVRALAREFNAVLVPFDGIFAAAACKQVPAYWAADGVHPTVAGHHLMAREWLRYSGIS